jgi:hypothetical protein
MEVVGVAVLWLAVGSFTAAVAGTKGYSPVLWFVIGMGLPTVGFIIALFLRRREAR